MKENKILSKKYFKIVFSFKISENKIQKSLKINHLDNL